MRNTLIIPLALLLGAAFGDEEKTCKGIRIDGKHYNEEQVKSDIYKPSSLAVDYKTNTLYFSYIHKTTDFTYKTAKFNLNTKEYAVLDINNGFTQTVDQSNHQLYIGGYKGVSKYDDRKRYARPFIIGVNVWDVFFKGILYYIEFITQTLNTYVDGKSTPFPDLADTKVYYFAIDDEDYMVYSNGSGLFGKKKGTKDAVLYKELKSVDDIRDIAIDKNGRAFVCSVDGIYKVDKAKESLEKVVDVVDAYGIAFDADNQMIYSKENALIRLVRNKSC